MVEQISRPHAVGRQHIFPEGAHRQLPVAAAVHHPAVDQSRFARIFRKGTHPYIDSYSAVFDNARKHDTGLDAYLKSRGVTDLDVCGLATDYCIKAMALTPGIWVSASG